ncbi:ATP-binding protein [Nocardia tengchongensis]|uniref:ATP-binding protein n=1 Tax=Nocardia tengchongensis TaxID=2055889 RepID=UPI003651A0A1
MSRCPIGSYPQPSTPADQTTRPTQIHPSARRGRITTEVSPADRRFKCRQISDVVIGRSAATLSADQRRTCRQISERALPFLLGLSSLPDALPGRSETIELFLLSQGEITGTPDGFVDAAFEPNHRFRTEPTELRRRDYLTLASIGGYPEAVRRTTPRRRAQFFKSYLDDIMSRDVHQVADIQRSSDMRRLIAALAAQSGGLLNYSRLSSDLGIPASTVRDYIGLLEVVYLIRLIPAWSANATARAIATPKVVFTDAGLAAHLLTGISNDATIGGIVETFVLGELTRQLTWSRTMAQLHHYRDRDGYEVDAVLEDNSGRIIGIEVKAAETVRTDDFRTLRILQKRLGDRFHGGYVLYCGDQYLPFGDRLWCLPISALWTTPPA